MYRQFCVQSEELVSKGRGFGGSIGELVSNPAEATRGRQPVRSLLPLFDTK
jgi:hypothetical protein